MEEIAPAIRGNALFRKLLLAAIAAFALLQPVGAQDGAAPADPQLARFATMSIRELDAFVSTISATVNQDTLRMRGFAQSNDCLDLTRVANSFALGYAYLAEIRDVAAGRSEKEAAIVRVRAIQVRVTTFAARVRAEDWLTQRCRDFAAPAEQAADPRYAKPAKVSNADYTDAVIEARQTAETNLAIAVAAGLSGKCPEAIAAAQNITLLMPYIQKLLTDTAKRPQVLGPRASRRGLEVSRQQLAAALNKLESQFGEKCRAPGATDEPPPADATPVE